MGEHNISEGGSGSGSGGFMRALLRDLNALEEIIESGAIETCVRRIGAEQELFLVDEGGHPALLALEVLDLLGDKRFTTELGLFNLEINLDPLVMEGDALSAVEGQLMNLLEQARTAACGNRAEILLAGILPTVRKSDLSLSSMTPMPRYEILNRICGELRGGPYDFRIMGVDELSVQHDNVMLEACNCSFQIHFQVGPDEFANLYNIAQVVSPPVLAAATNSPMLFGKNLWQETRVPLFQQSIDTRASSDHLRERHPRVSFGNRWVKSSILELFKEDIARFRALIGPEITEDPFERLQAGEIPSLQALCLHNGTVYRWNRPCYGITDGKPHLRIENRILPSGPTPRDEVANMALWLGLISRFSHLHEDVSSLMDFSAAKGNFFQAARHGLAAQFEWLDGETYPARNLLLDQLLPLAREGLTEKNIRAEDIDLYLGVITDRVESGQTGSKWINRSYAAMSSTHSLGERMGAVTAAMISRQRQGDPVHLWKLAELTESAGWTHSFQKVEQVMTTDLFSVQDDEPLELVAQLMDWERIRHMLVEDKDGKLVGLISYRAILRDYARRETRPDEGTKRVREVMRTDLVTVPPETPTLDALRLMRKNGIGCLPVLQDDRLVGVVTERDFLEVSGSLLEEQLSGQASTAERRSPGGCGE